MRKKESEQLGTGPLEKARCRLESEGDGNSYQFKCGVSLKRNIFFKLFEYKWLDGNTLQTLKEGSKFDALDLPFVGDISNERLFYYFDSTFKLSHSRSGTGIPARFLFHLVGEADQNKFDIKYAVDIFDWLPKSRICYYSLNTTTAPGSINVTFFPNDNAPLLPLRIKGEALRFVLLISLNLHLLCIDRKACGLQEIEAEHLLVWPNATLNQYFENLREGGSYHSKKNDIL